MDAQPAANDSAAARATSAPRRASPACAKSFAPSTPAPAMATMPSRRENRAASVRDRPHARPAVMVIPARLTPGTRANTCATPMSSAPRQDRPSTDVSTGARASTHHSSAPPSRVVQAMTSRARRASGLNTCSASPASTTGTLAAATCRASRPAGARAMAHTSRRKYTSTEPSVPTCTAMSSSALSPQPCPWPSSAWVRTRWPLELMGRNSVTPCTRARIRIESQSMSFGCLHARRGGV